MMLSEIVKEQPVPEIEVLGIKDDSRQVDTGDLFLAVQGETVDGRDYLDDAIRNGAVAAVCEAPAPVLTAIPVIPMEQLAMRSGVFASRFYGQPSDLMTIVAVTGTNGKTSFTHLMADALGTKDVNCGLIGTMGHGRPGRLKEPGLTTPPAVELQRRLSDLVSDGCEIAVLEASSHGIVQHRLSGCAVDVAVLTNITHDHLDYHKTMEAYRSAKEQLFHLPGLRSAVVNRDDEYAETLISRLPESVDCIDYSMNESNRSKVSLDRVSMHAGGLRISLSCLGESVNAKVPLFGSFNVQNVLAVAATLVAMGWQSKDIEQALRGLRPVAGRMEVIKRAGKPTIIVDYAHTPDALEKILSAIREHYPTGRLTTVFGCGGDRDSAKRPVMGEIASRLSNHVIVTSDNPRSEDPGQIIQDIVAGVTGDFSVDADRGAAIYEALRTADEHDIVLVAGKGHEDYQELATGRIAYSDFDVIDEALGRKNAIVGIGATGLSYTRHLMAANKVFAFYDDHPSDAALADLETLTGQPVTVLPIAELNAESTSSIYLSPGVPLTQENIRIARQAGTPVHGDVALFGDLVSSPIVAITGTNGKTTVAHLVHALISDQRDGVVLAGNVGTPVLDVLDPDVDCYVLEASSYQLELANELGSEVAVVLNLSPDHLDRYPDLDTYYNTKLALYDHCRAAVLNRHLARRVDREFNKSATFGTDRGDKAGHFGLIRDDGEVYLANGSEALMSIRELQLKGSHNLENVLAALAIGWLLDLDMQQMLASVRNFSGLPHRGEMVAEIHGVRYLNDSKATNPGAMVSSVMGCEGNVHLLAGGDPKGLGFVSAARDIASSIRSLALIGEQRAEMAEALQSLEPQTCDSMIEAVRYLASRAKPGDVVLLAPGCASLDQYSNYMERGEKFREAVGGLA